MSNKTGPIIERCETPLCKSAQELRQLPILTCCVMAIINKTPF